MLSLSELTSLYNIISDEEKTLQNISDIFQKTYSKSEQFKLGITLWYLIKDNLLNLPQRISSFFILYDMYQLDKTNTIPFIPIILESLKNSKHSEEKKFLIDFLNNNIIYQKTIKNILEEKLENENIEIEKYYEKYNKSSEKIPKIINDWIRPIIYENKTENNNNLFNLSQLTPKDVSFNYFEPNYLSYYPNNQFPFFDNEPLWIMPSLKHELIWDYNQNKDKVYSYLHHFNNLNEEKIIFCLNEIEHNPILLKEINFNSIKMMELIEVNQDFSFQLLMKISKNTIFEEYLTQFLKMKFTNNSMNVLNKILLNVSLPKTYINAYIKHIISNYKEEIKEEEKKEIKNSLCNFILNLIENKIITKDDLPNEVNEIIDL